MGLIKIINSCAKGVPHLGMVSAIGNAIYIGNEDAFISAGLTLALYCMVFEKKLSKSMLLPRKRNNTISYSSL